MCGIRLEGGPPRVCRGRPVAIAHHPSVRARCPCSPMAPPRIPRAPAGPAELEHGRTRSDRAKAPAQPSPRRVTAASDGTSPIDLLARSGWQRSPFASGRRQSFTWNHRRGGAVCRALGDAVWAGGQVHCWHSWDPADRPRGQVVLGAVCFAPMRTSWGRCARFESSGPPRYVWNSCSTSTRNLAPRPTIRRAAEVPNRSRSRWLTSRRPRSWADVCLDVVLAHRRSETPRPCELGWEKAPCSVR